MWSRLSEAIRNLSVIIKQLDKPRDRARAFGPEVLSEIKGIDRQLTGIDKEQGRLPDAYTDGVISLERLKVQMAKVEQGFETRRVDLVTQLEKEKELRCEPDSIEQIFGKISKRLKTIQGDFEAKRYLVPPWSLRSSLKG